jgi:hypothetical protein
MKNYDMTNTSSSENDIVAKHKADKNKTLGKATKPLEREDDVEFDDIDDIDDIDDNDDDDNDNKSSKKSSNIQNMNVTDSIGEEVKLKDPLWKTNEKRNAKMEKQINSGKKDIEDFSTMPMWQKPPSRMSVKAWFITLLLLLVPGINIILLFTWSFFSDSVVEEKKNFCRASLYLTMIAMVIAIILSFQTKQFKAYFSKIKHQAISVTEDFKNYADDALHDEADNAKDNYDNLTDDNFTQ